MKIRLYRKYITKINLYQLFTLQPYFILLNQILLKIVSFNYAEDLLV